MGTLCAVTMLREGRSDEQKSDTTILTLLVLPALYVLLRRETRHTQSQDNTVPIVRQGG